MTLLFAIIFHNLHFEQQIDGDHNNIANRVAQRCNFTLHFKQV